MENKKRFLILTSDSGFGHRSAAVSVSKALDHLYGDRQVNLVVNPILESNTLSLMKPIEKNYDKGIKNIPSLWKIGYEFSDSRQVSELMESALTVLLQQSIGEKVDSFLPHGILITNPMFNAPAHKVRKDYNPDVPLYSTVTDLADVHSLWFAPGPDLLFIASDWVRVKARENRVLSRKLKISGIPVSPNFELNKASKSEMRARLGLEPDVRTILFVGSVRVDHILENLHALEKQDHQFQVVVITGGNEDLFRELQINEFEFPVKILGFVDNMPDWMMASDLLVTKAGGLILSEGLAAGLPILLVDFLPGQEEGNVRYVTSHQAGAQVMNVGEFKTMIDFWLKDDAVQLKRTAASSKLIGRPDAAFEVAKHLWEATQSIE
ncbi:MAG: MGDG synthase family glycosyltransferase [Anaerolineaceae bacterium]